MNKNRKMVIVLLFAFVVCFSLSGCTLQDRIEEYSSDKEQCYLNTENVTRFSYKGNDYTILAEELKEYCSHLYGIMPNERMFRFTKSYMEHEIVRGIKETGVKRIRIHDLRHSHASLLVELGFQPLAIAERLGHEKIETTLNTYSHLYPNKQAELADRLELENEEDEL